MILAKMYISRTISRVHLNKNSHFWIIFFLTLILIALYSAWPWTEVMRVGIGRLVSMTTLRDLGVFEFTHHMVCSLFIIPILYSTIVFSWRGAAITWIIAFSIVVYKVIDFVSPAEVLLVSALFLFLPLLVAMVFTIEVNWRKKQREMLVERETEREVMRRASMLNMIEAQENERKYIAHNLHDDIIQNLLTISNRTEMLLSDNNTNDSKKYLEWMNSIILETVDDLKRLCAHLRPSALDRLGFVPALRVLIDRMYKECGIEVRLLVNGEERKLPANIEINFFRVMQEALNNVRRHSKATMTILRVHFNHDSFKVVIEDNGQGFDKSRIKEIINSENKLGLAGMRWRMESIGGLLHIDSKSGENTVIMAEIDLNKYQNMHKLTIPIEFRNEFDTYN